MFRILHSENLYTFLKSKIHVCLQHGPSILRLSLQTLEFKTRKTSFRHENINMNRSYNAPCRTPVPQLNECPWYNRLFTIYGHGDYFSVTRTIWIYFHFPIQKWVSIWNLKLIDPVVSNSRCWRGTETYGSHWYTLSSAIRAFRLSKLKIKH